MSWYSALVMYGCHDTGGALLVEDSDIKLIPSIIEKVLLPKLTGIPILSIFNDGYNAQSDHLHITASRGSLKHFHVLNGKLKGWMMCSWKML